MLQFDYRKEERKAFISSLGLYSTIYSVTNLEIRRNGGHVNEIAGISPVSCPMSKSGSSFFVFQRFWKKYSLMKQSCRKNKNCQKNNPGRIQTAAGTDMDPAAASGNCYFIIKSFIITIC